MSLFTIYSSSAGSGKTFTLTKEYLKLILNSEKDYYFQSVLAMTFTNDAAEEMKTRILETLKQLSEKTESSADMLALLLSEMPNLSEEIIQQRAQKAHHKILHNYNDFSVKTIDSFVNQIVSSFTFDLNLPFNYEIVLNTKDLITEAVNNLLDKVGDDEILTELFKEFALSKVEDDKSWNQLQESIIEFAQIIYTSNNLHLIEENSKLSYADTKKIKSQINAYLKEASETIKSEAEKALTAIRNAGLEITDFKGGSRGSVGIFFSKCNNDPFFIEDPSVPNSNILSAIEKNEWYSKTAAKGNQVAIDGISEELKNGLVKILSFKNDKLLIFKQLKNDLYMIPFLSIIKKEIDALLQERNQVVLADFNKKILDIVSSEPVPYIFERIGEKYNHILVDEFQDTSDMQFFNLLPLFENIIAKNNANLIVGDPKQAIYSWRGGNVMLMLDLIGNGNKYLNTQAPEIQQEQIQSLILNKELKNLSTNYRSTEQIINFNNQLFTSIISSETTPIIKEVFSDYIQQVPAKPKQGGYIELEILNQENVDYNEKVLETISKILEDGFSLSDIAILVRGKAHGQEIAEILNQNGYAVKSDEALKLYNNLAIRFLTSGLVFAANPEKEFNRFEFLQYFFRITNRDSSHIDLAEICKANPLEFKEHFLTYNIDLKGLEGLPPYQLLEFLIERFQLMKNQADSPYLFAFLDYAIDFTNKTSKILIDFLNDWYKKIETKSIDSSSGNAITIQTIHKSKGLQYPVVIMPKILWETTPKPGSSTWIDISNLKFPELSVGEKSLIGAPFKYSSKVEAVQPILEKEKTLLLIENLNLLYVALTRAVHRQYLWIWEDKKKIKGIGQYLMNFLSNQEGFETGKTVYSFGEPSSFTKKVILESQETFNTKLPAVFSGASELNLMQDFSFDDDRIKLGNLIHLAFERIYKAEDVAFVLDSLVYEGRLEKVLQDEIETKIMAVINHPELSMYFGETAHVKNEIEILSSHTQVRRPDRLIFINNEVHILDYKTGKKSKSHEKQLRDYAQLLRQMSYSKIHLTLVYLDPLKIVKFQ